MGTLDINTGFYTVALRWPNSIYTRAKQQFTRWPKKAFTLHTGRYLHCTTLNSIYTYSHTGRSQHISHTMAEQHCTHGPNSIDIAIDGPAINITPHTGQTTLHTLRSNALHTGRTIYSFHTGRKTYQRINTRI